MLPSGGVDAIVFGFDCTRGAFSEKGDFGREDRAGASQTQFDEAEILME